MRTAKTAAASHKDMLAVADGLPQNLYDFTCGRWGLNGLKHGRRCDLGSVVSMPSSDCRQAQGHLLGSPLPVGSSLGIPHWCVLKTDAHRGSNVGQVIP